HSNVSPGHIPGVPGLLQPGFAKPVLVGTSQEPTPPRPSLLLLSELGRLLVEPLPAPLSLFQLLLDVVRPLGVTRWRLLVVLPPPVVAQLRLLFFLPPAVAAQLPRTPWLGGKSAVRAHTPQPLGDNPELDRRASPAPPALALLSNLPSPIV